MMQRLHEMSEGDTDELGRNLSQIMAAADAMAAAGVPKAFEVYKLARGCGLDEMYGDDIFTILEFENEDEDGDE